MLVIVHSITAHISHQKYMPKAEYKLAFHVNSRAVTLPGFEPVALPQANRIIWELENVGVSSGH